MWQNVNGVFRPKIAETYTILDEKTGERKTIHVETKLSNKEWIVWILDSGERLAINPKTTWIETVAPVSGPVAEDEDRRSR